MLPLASVRSSTSSPPSGRMRATGTPGATNRAVPSVKTVPATLYCAWQPRHASPAWWPSPGGGVAVGGGCAVAAGVSVGRVVVGSATGTGALARTSASGRSAASAAAWPRAPVATGVPAAIKDGPGSFVTVSEAQQSEHQFVGAWVRWGGTILSVRNREMATEIEILARATDANGEPDPEGDGQGRFIATVNGFLDPAEYPKDRLLTVVGTLERVETRPVGDYPYRFPIVNTIHRYLWPPPVPDAYPYAYFPYGYPGLWGPLW